jgi:hypothetical protein
MVFWTVMPRCLVDSSNVPQELFASVSDQIHQGYISVVFWIMTVPIFVGCHQSFDGNPASIFRVLQNSLLGAKLTCNLNAE